MPQLVPLMLRMHMELLLRELLVIMLLLLLILTLGIMSRMLFICWLYSNVGSIGYGDVVSTVGTSAPEDATGYVDPTNAGNFAPSWRLKLEK